MERALGIPLLAIGYAACTIPLWPQLSLGFGGLARVRAARRALGVTKGLMGLQLATTDMPFALPSHPVVTITIGVLAGVLCLVASRYSVGVMRPEHPAMGLALTVVLLFARLAFSAVVLGVYRAITSQGFVIFSCAYIGGFLVAYNYELLQFSGLLRRGLWQKGR